MNIQLILYVAAAIILLIGAIVNPPRFDVTRCIAFALALIVLAQVVSG